MFVPKQCIDDMAPIVLPDWYQVHGCDEQPEPTHAKQGIVVHFRHWWNELLRWVSEQPGEKAVENCSAEFETYSLGFVCRLSRKVVVRMDGHYVIWPGEGQESKN